MPIDSGNLALKGLDDLFSTEENRQEEQREQVQQIPIDALHPFTNHPFKVLDDEAMTRTVESIAQYGVLAPLIARPRPDGDGYEIISGHRRQYAAKLAGLDTLPVIVRQMSDDAAVILMVDSNLQREHILPSERAFAYKMKLEALKNQGARSDLTSPQVAAKFRSDDAVAKDQGISGDTLKTEYHSLGQNNETSVTRGPVIKKTGWLKKPMWSVGASPHLPRCIPNPTGVEDK